MQLVWPCWQQKLTVQASAFVFMLSCLAKEQSTSHAKVTNLLLLKTFCSTSLVSIRPSANTPASLHPLVPRLHSAPLLQAPARSVGGLVLHDTDNTAAPSPDAVGNPRRTFDSPHTSQLRACCWPEALPIAKKQPMNT